MCHTLIKALSRRSVREGDLCIMRLYPGTPLVRKSVNDVLTIVALADDVMRN